MFPFPTAARVRYGFAGHGPDCARPSGGLDVQFNGDHLRLRPLTPAGEPVAACQVAVPMRSAPELIARLHDLFGGWLYAGGHLDQPIPGPAPRPRRRSRRPDAPAEAPATQWRTLYGFAGYGPGCRYPSSGLDLEARGDHVRLVPLSPQGAPAESCQIAVPMVALPDVLARLSDAVARWKAEGERSVPVPRTRVRRRRAAPAPADAAPAPRLAC